MVSLDGYIESSDRDLEWGIVDEELHRFINLDGPYKKMPAEAS